jgi:hypothetical protein
MTKIFSHLYKLRVEKVQKSGKVLCFVSIINRAQAHDALEEVRVLEFVYQRGIRAPSSKGTSDCGTGRRLPFSS